MSSRANRRDDREVTPLCKHAQYNTNTGATVTEVQWSLGNPDSRQSVSLGGLDNFGRTTAQYFSMELLQQNIIIILTEYIMMW